MVITNESSTEIGKKIKWRQILRYILKKFWFFKKNFNLAMILDIWNWRGTDSSFIFHTQCFQLSTYYITLENTIFRYFTLSKRDDGSCDSKARGEMRLKCSCGLNWFILLELPWCPVVRAMCFHYRGAQVQSLIRELRSHMLYSAEKKKKKAFHLFCLSVSLT